MIPLVFGIGTALTSTVGVNIGAGNVRRAEHFAWTGSAAAALIAGAVGVVLAIEPGLWLDLFTDDPAAYAAGAGYLTIVGPLFAFQGVGLALYFASQGAGRVVWPVIATALRLVVAVGGGALVLYVLDDGLRGIYVCIAASMLVYGAVTAGAIRLGAWRD